MTANRITELALPNRVSLLGQTAPQKIGNWLPVPLSSLALVHAHATLMRVAHAAAVAQVAQRRLRIAHALGAYRWN